MSSKRAKRGLNATAADEDLTDKMQKTCKCSNCGLVPFEELGLKPVHQVMLVLWRHVCFGYANDNFKTWDHTMDLAEEKLGLLRGPALVSRLVLLMRAFRFERSEGFNFLPPNVASATTDEQNLIRMVYLAQQWCVNPDAEQAMMRELRGLADAASPYRTYIAINGIAALCNKCEAHEESRELCVNGHQKHLH
jgi:hypothetical protein